MKQAELKELIIVGKFDDGKCRQILLSSQYKDVILGVISACEGRVIALEEEVEGIDIIKPITP